MWWVIFFLSWESLKFMPNWTWIINLKLFIFMLFPNKLPRRKHTSVTKSHYRSPKFFLLHCTWEEITKITLYFSNFLQTFPKTLVFCIYVEPRLLPIPYMIETLSWWLVRVDKLHIMVWAFVVIYGTCALYILSMPKLVQLWLESRFWGSLIYGLVESDIL